jgi:DNA-binding NtrC family response regulator
VEGSNVVVGKRLLAVDDNADSAELVARIAGRCGYETRTASVPTDVRQVLAEWKPDVVTLDLCMPDIDAIDLFPVLKEAAFGGPVLIISGLDPWLRRSATKLATARGLNVVGDMEKPLDPAMLRRKLAEVRDAL